MTASVELLSRPPRMNVLKPFAASFAACGMPFVTKTAVGSWRKSIMWSVVVPASR